MRVLKRIVTLLAVCALVLGVLTVTLVGRYEFPGEFISPDGRESATVTIKFLRIPKALTGRFNCSLHLRGSDGTLEELKLLSAQELSFSAENGLKTAKASVYLPEQKDSPEATLYYDGDMTMLFIKAEAAGRAKPGPFVFRSDNWTLPDPE